MHTITSGILIVKAYKREGVLPTGGYSPVGTKTLPEGHTRVVSRKRQYGGCSSTYTIWYWENRELPVLALLVSWRIPIPSNDVHGMEQTTWSHPHSTKNSTPFPSNQDRDLFPLIHWNKKSYVNVNAYHLVKIRNKLLDIWNWKTDLQRISSTNNTWKVPSMSITKCRWRKIILYAF